MDLATILAELESLLNRPMLFDEREVGPRAAAIDFLRFAAGSIRAYERSHGVASTTQHLYAEATRLEHALREVDRAFFEKIRDDIRSGRLVGSRLRRFCDRFTSYEPHRDTHLHVGLDPLDTLVAGVLHSTPPPQPTGPLEPGMVAFQPSPMSVVLELVDQTPMGADDVFYDLGSGLGDIALMVHLLTGVRTYGVEIDPGLCTYAQDQATALGLSGIMFINADVRSVDIGDGTLFYLFTPFSGDLLAEVVAKLKAAARQHPIRMGTYGPITPIVAGIPWLESVNRHQEDPFRLAVFRSRDASGARYSS